MKIESSFLSIIPLTLLVLACSKPTTPAVQEKAIEAPSSTSVTLTKDQFKTASIEVTSLELRNINGTIKANGMLDVPPKNLVTVSAPIGGFVKNTELLQGMKVTKGQVLVSLEHQDYIQLQQDYLDSKSQLEFLDLDYQRQQELAKENVNAAKALQLSRSNYFSMKAKVQGLKARLQLINIDIDQLEKGVMTNTINLYAPISGYITQVNINIGMHVNPADIMIRIIDNEHLHAEAQVFEKDIAKLKVGQRVHVTLSNESKEREAKVYLIGKEMTAERTVRVHCHLEVEDHSLIPGMFFSAIIETDQQQAKCLPDKAIVTFDGKDYVFIVKNQNERKYEMMEVKRGASSDGFTEIILSNNLSDKALFVSRGAYELLSFLKNTEE